MGMILTPFILNAVRTEPHDRFKQTVHQKIQVLCTSNPKFETKNKTVGSSFFCAA